MLSEDMQFVSILCQNNSFSRENQRFLLLPTYLFQAGRRLSESPARAATIESVYDAQRNQHVPYTIDANFPSGSMKKKITNDTVAQT